MEAITDDINIQRRQGCILLTILNHSSYIQSRVADYGVKRNGEPETIILYQNGERLGLRVNIAETKLMILGRRTTNCRTTCHDQVVH